jgi:hypothetical protein
MNAETINRTRRTKRWQRAMGGVAALTVAGATMFVASPASAAQYVGHPPRMFCDSSTARVAVAPPVVRANPGAPEAVLWVNQVQRYNGSTWVNEGPAYYHYSLFNSYGQSVTSWSVFGTSTGGWYANNFLRLPVRYQGWHRVYSIVAAANGGVAQGHVGGANSYCWMS